jgi:hypothetical protein
MRKLTLRTGIVAGGAVAATTFAVAFAAWTSNGTGSGTAQSIEDLTSSITAAVFVPDLYPGADKTVTVSINNPNAYPVVVTSISAGSSNATTGGCVAGMVLSDARTFDNAGLAKSGGGTQIAALGSGTYTLDVHMDADPANNCKLQTFTLPLTATLRSDAS